mmetsp:Transcript_58618/g.168307  ORF Transcript_58618/g.168307 Transcript_58618/m.168307 type:complete len:523 (+) Transcript_58618:1-1569(+)
MSICAAPPWELHAKNLYSHMGCVGSREPSEPDRVCSTTAGADSSPDLGVSAADVGLDDLDWVPAASSSGALVTPAAALLIEREAMACSKPQLPLRVQILLDGGWKDCSDDDTREICRRLRKGELQFTLHARGQNYSVDFLAANGATQLNVTTGKIRMLRILDRAEDDDITRTKTAGSLKTGSSGTLSTLGSRSLDLAQQLEFGAQSKRGGATRHPFKVLEGNPHAQECFKKFEQNEAKLCGEWGVFYHSYSFAALIYEVQAAVGSVLFRFRSQYAPLPRLLVKDFNEIPDAPCLAQRFTKDFATNKRDHHPSFRRVAVSCMCSLSSTGPEACTAMVFIAGYSCKDLSFRTVLENLLESCYVPKAKVKALATGIIALSEKHGLDVSQFGGKPCSSGKAGHLLQIFVRRPLIDKLAYSAKPYGPIDEDRMPISGWMNSNKSHQVGQARVVAHPKYFMRADSVRMYVASADPTFHAHREEFQKELVGLLSVILGEPELRQRAATGVYGGSLPSWWSAEDQRNHMG